MGRLVVEALPRAVVEAIDRGLQGVVGHALGIGPFRKYWRRRPLVFSFVPLCQAAYGSAKYTAMPVSRPIAGNSAHSLPLSRVSAWRREAATGLSNSTLRVAKVPALRSSSRAANRVEQIFA